MIRGLWSRGRERQERSPRAVVVLCVTKMDIKKKLPKLNLKFGERKIMWRANLDF